MLIRQFVCAGLLSLTGEVRAQEPQPVDPRFVRATAVADRLIAAARVEDIFDNATTGDSAVARHKESGFRCAFLPDDVTAQIIVSDIGLSRGDAVSCQMRKFDMDLTLSVRRQGDGLTAESALNAAAESFRRDYPGAQSRSEVIQGAGNEGFAPISGVAFRYETAQGPVDIHAATTSKAGWVYELRMTYENKTSSPGESAGAAMMAQLLFRGALPETGR